MLSTTVYVQECRIFCTITLLYYMHLFFSLLHHVFFELTVDVVRVLFFFLLGFRAVSYALHKTGFWMLVYHLGSFLKVKKKTKIKDIHIHTHTYIYVHECSSWYNGVGRFLMSVWDRRRVLCGDGSVCKVSQTNPTPECKAHGIECYGGCVYKSGDWDNLWIVQCKPQI